MRKIGSDRKEMVRPDRLQTGLAGRFSGYYSCAKIVTA